MEQEEEKAARLSLKTEKENNIWNQSGQKHSALSGLL